MSVARDAFHAPIGDRNFLFLAAAIVGSVFNPWMVFYQQSATARKNMRPDAYTAARWDTAFGALLTQALTGAVLVAAAATLYAGARVTSLTSIGQVGEALSAALGQETGRLIFSLGVLGASLAAAIVASLALSWGVAEVLGPHRRAKSRAHPRLFNSPWFVALFVASLFGAAALAGASDDLVGLNIAAQVANALLFPSRCRLSGGSGVENAGRALPAAWRRAAGDRGHRDDGGGDRPRWRRGRLSLNL